MGSWTAGRVRRTLDARNTGRTNSRHSPAGALVGWYTHPFGQKGTGTGGWRGARPSDRYPTTSLCRGRHLPRGVRNLPHYLGGATMAFRRMPGKPPSPIRPLVMGAGSLLLLALVVVVDGYLMAPHFYLTRSFF